MRNIAFLIYYIYFVAVRNLLIVIFNIIFIIVLTATIGIVLDSTLEFYE